MSPGERGSGQIQNLSHWLDSHNRLTSHEKQDQTDELLKSR
jgi:hypothetical protein